MPGVQGVTTYLKTAFFVDAFVQGCGLASVAEVKRQTRAAEAEKLAPVSQPMSHNRNVRRRGRPGRRTSLRSRLTRSHGFPSSSDGQQGMRTGSFALTTGLPCRAAHHTLSGCLIRDDDDAPSCCVLPLQSRDSSLCVFQWRPGGRSWRLRAGGKRVRGCEADGSGSGGRQAPEGREADGGTWTSKHVFLHVEGTRRVSPYPETSAVAAPSAIITALRPRRFRNVRSTCPVSQ